MTTSTDEYDVVCLGGGCGGLVAAIVARQLGLRTLLVEKTELIGGVTAYSQGQLWMAASHIAASAGIPDSQVAGASYLEQVGRSFGSPDHIAAYSALAPRVTRYLEEKAGLSWQLVDLPDYYYPDFADSRIRGRYLEVTPFPGRELGAWRDRLRVSPYVPYRLTNAELSALPIGARSHLWGPDVVSSRAGGDVLALGTGLAAYLLRAALESGLDFLFPAAIQTARRLEANTWRLDFDTAAGSRRVVARAGVIIATSGYDWDDAFARGFGGHLGMTSAAPRSVTGDHLRLAAMVGARLSQTPKPSRLSAPSLGTVEGHPQWNTLGAIALPHAILVDAEGNRFADESFYADVGHAIKYVDGRQLRLRHWPCWMVFDQQFRDRYSFGGVRPGAEFPESWGVISAPSVPELARRSGIDQDGLVAQIERFNASCAGQRDVEFGRGDRPWSCASYGDRDVGGNPCLGPVSQPPYYAYRPGIVGNGISTTGIATDPHGRALGFDNQPVSGIYALGNSATLVETGAGYQSGVANTRAAVVAYAAIHDAAGRTLLPEELVPAP